MASRKNVSTQNDVPAIEGVALEMMNLEFAKFAEIISTMNLRIVELETKLEAKNGPKSERAMTDDDARRIMPLGDFESASHKECAEKLNLSYGQIYSCRKGFTFKHIAKEIEKKIEALKNETNE